MSKAIEFVRTNFSIHVGEPDTFRFAIGSCETNVACLGIFGGGKSVKVSPQEAVALGRWLIDTFGESEQQEKSE